MIVCDEIQMGMCPDKTCKCVHLTLLDGGKPIASAALRLEYIGDFATQLHNHAYSVAALKDQT